MPCQPRRAIFNPLALLNFLFINMHARLMKINEGTVVSCSLLPFLLAWPRSRSGILLSESLTKIYRSKKGDMSSKDTGYWEAIRFAALCTVQTLARTTFTSRQSHHVLVAVVLCLICASLHPEDRPEAQLLRPYRRIMSIDPAYTRFVTVLERNKRLLC